MFTYIASKCPDMDTHLSRKGILKSFSSLPMLFGEPVINVSKKPDVVGED